MLTVLSVDSSRPTESMKRHVISILLTIRRSFIAFVVTLGTLSILIGALVQDGAVAGFLGIWGVSAYIFAALGYIGLRLIGYT